MPAFDWADSAKMGYLSRAWPAPTCCVYALCEFIRIMQRIMKATGKTTDARSFPTPARLLHANGPSAQIDCLQTASHAVQVIARLNPSY